MKLVKFCPFEMKKVFSGVFCMSLGVRPQGSSTAPTTAWSLASAVGYLQGLLGSSVVPLGQRPHVRAGSSGVELVVVCTYHQRVKSLIPYVQSDSRYRRH